MGLRALDPAVANLESSEGHGIWDFPKIRGTYLILGSSFLRILLLIPYFGVLIF